MTVVEEQYSDLQPILEKPNVSYRNQTQGRRKEKKEGATGHQYHWVCGEILPHFDMHHIFAASKLRKLRNFH